MLGSVAEGRRLGESLLCILVLAGFSQGECQVCEAVGVLGRQFGGAREGRGGVRVAIERVECGAEIGLSFKVVTCKNV